MTVTGCRADCADSFLDDQRACEDCITRDRAEIAELRAIAADAIDKFAVLMRAVMPLHVGEFHDVKELRARLEKAGER